VLMAVSRQAKRVYSQRDMTMIEGLAREAAFALHVQRLRTDQQRASAELVKLNVELERRVAERTAQLEAANKELEAFSYSVSHDLRAPLRAIDGFSLALLEDYAAMLDPVAQDYLNRVRHNTRRMGELIEDLLKLSRLGSAELNLSEVDITALANKIMRQLMDSAPERVITTEIAPALKVRADARLTEIVLTNLLDNAWKYTGRTSNPHIVVGQARRDGQLACFVKDNGAGFDMRYASMLFGAFQRLHGKEFTGSGVGLAIVARIIHRHGGKIWAEAELDNGATFYFTLGNNIA
jgi:light-regulated signal transduction histidine kinase (bacteriophytochrome)